MKNYLISLSLCLRFIFISSFVSFSLQSSSQRNVTTIRLNGGTIKKKPIVDSLAEWMSRSDLRKADSCIQIIFNAVHRKDTAAEIKGIKGLQTLVNSEKYAAESNMPSGGLCCIFKLKCCPYIPINPYPDKKKVFQ